eukprot:10869988-Heterocapsa_arctica.AAC.1
MIADMNAQPILVTGEFAAQREKLEVVRGHRDHPTRRHDTARQSWIGYALIGQDPTTPSSLTAMPKPFFDFMSKGLPA